MTTSGPDTPISLAAGFAASDDAAWRALVDKALKGANFDRLVSHTADGIEIAPLYTKQNSPTYEAQPLPPQRCRLTQNWRIAQIRPETSPAHLNAAIAADIDGGADAATIQLEATGRSGLPADAASIEQALTGLPLDRIRLSLSPGANGIAAAAAFTGVLRKRGAESALAGLGIDPLGHLARTGEWSLLKREGNGFAAKLPWLPAPATTLLADTRPYHEAGASEAQEIAALLSTLVAYLRWCEADGIAPSSALPRIGLAMSVDADIFLGIAKLRAARQLVARVAQACGAADAAVEMQLAVATSERMMARRDPWVNMLRVTSAAAAAAIGGADEIMVLPYTWALGQPDAQTSRIARNVGMVLREEAGLGRIADPAGGAFAVEHLTRELAAKAWAMFQGWESKGGMLAVLTSGLVWNEIVTVAQARMSDIAHRRIELTGVSAYPDLAPDGVETQPWPTPPLGKADAAIRILVPHRLCQAFETLRDAADQKTSATGTRPSVFLAALGAPAEHTPRTTWITNLLAAGGIDVIANEGFTASGEAGLAFANSGANVACICGSDEAYGLLGDATAMALKGAGASHVVLAGRPGLHREVLMAAGVDQFIHAGMDVVLALEQIHRALGIELEAA